MQLCVLVVPFLAGSLGDFSVSRCVKNTEALVPLLARSHACNHMRPEVEDAAGADLDFVGTVPAHSLRL